MTFERYADILQTAMRVEKIMNKEVAEIFDVPASYMSTLNKTPEKTPAPFMDKIRAWHVTGKLLREYKLPTPAELLEAVPQEVKEAAKEQAAATPAPAPEPPPLSKEEKKEQKAARLRELYRRSKPPKKDPKPEEGKFTEPEGVPGQSGGTFIIPRGGDKADPSIINIRTGTVIFTAEVTNNEIILRFPLVREEEKK